MRVERQRRTGRPVTLLGVTSDDRMADGVTGPAISTIGTLAEAAPDLWGQDVPSRGILERVVGDARASDILGRRLADTPSSFLGVLPSPLARAAPEDFGRFSVDQELLDALLDEDSAPSGERPVPVARFVVGNLISNGTRDISLQVDHDVVGALVFSVDSVIMPFPAGTESISVRYSPDPGFQEREREEASERIERQVSNRSRPILIWRAYQGTNTGIFDGVTDELRAGWHRVKLAAVGSGVFVGKIVFAVHRRLPGPRRDPTASRRRKSIELLKAEFVASCPDIGGATGPLPNVAVAVHGTMACAVHLAEALQGRTDLPLLRYEHDTWLPIQANARELADRLRDLEVERAVLIGHSRGGLVIRHAAEIAQAERKEISIRCVTLGTPFKGTPYAGAARTALLGARAFLGILRYSSGALVVDAPTRLAGLLIRGGVPAGIDAMDVGSDYFSGFAHRSPTATTTVAGDIDPAGPKVANGIGFLRGMAADAFLGQPSDLVVSTESAAGDCDDTYAVASDHFSYLLHDESLAAIGRALKAVEAERHAAFLEDTDMSRGTVRPIPVPRPLVFPSKTSEESSEVPDDTSTG